MNNKQLQLVTFEQAKKLKELGFDYGCEWFYDNKKHIQSAGFDFWNNKEYNAYSAQTTALALKWLRDEKKIKICVDFNNNVSVRNAIEERFIYVNVLNDKSYEQAESAGLDYALDYLLKQMK